MAKMFLGSVPQDAWQLIGILGAAVLCRQPCPGCPERCPQRWRPTWHQSQPWFCLCAPGCPQSGHSIAGLAQHTKCPGWSLAGAGGHRKDLKLRESIQRDTDMGKGLEGPQGTWLVQLEKRLRGDRRDVNSFLPRDSCRLRSL